MTEKDLKPRGSTIKVTNRNKVEYVDLMVKWRLSRGVSEQEECFRKVSGRPLLIMSN